MVLLVDGVSVIPSSYPSRHATRMHSVTGSEERGAGSVSISRWKAARRSERAGMRMNRIHWPCHRKMSDPDHLLTSGSGRHPSEKEQEGRQAMSSGRMKGGLAGGSRRRRCDVLV